MRRRAVVDVEQHTDLDGILYAWSLTRRAQRADVAAPPALGKGELFQEPRVPGP